MRNIVGDGGGWVERVVVIVVVDPVGTPWIALTFELPEVVGTLVVLFGRVEVGIPEPPKIPPGEEVAFPTIRSLIVTCVVGGERGVIGQEGLNLLEFVGRRLLIPGENWNVCPLPYSKYTMSLKDRHGDRRPPVSVEESEVKNNLTF